MDPGRLIVAVTLLSYWVLRVALSFVTKRLHKRAEATASRPLSIVAQMLAHTSHLLLFAFSLLIGLKVVELPARWEVALSHGWFIALAFQVALWADMAVRLWWRV